MTGSYANDQIMAANRKHKVKVGGDCSLGLGVRLNTSAVNYGTVTKAWA